MSDQVAPTPIPASLQQQVQGADGASASAPASSAVQPVSTSQDVPAAQTLPTNPSSQGATLPQIEEAPAHLESVSSNSDNQTAVLVSTTPPPPPQPNLELIESLKKYDVPEVVQLATKLEYAQLPPDLKLKAENQISRIALTLKYGGSLAQLDITTKYIDWITALPWFTRSEDVLDVNKVKAALDASHFGLDVLKKKILEFLSIIALQKKAFDQMHYQVQSPMFVGLAGTGKTTFAKAIADALGRKFVRIPFGGLSSARDLRGQSKTSPESEPGLVVRALRDAGTRNPVILLDELDRVSPDARAEIMGVLLELLDPGQNSHFTDNFIDFPFDLSEVLFVATGNNTTNVAAAVLDRLEVIQMPSYTDEEKMAIGKHYVLPQMIQQVGLKPDQLTIDEALWPKMVRPLGFEPGIRSLERMVQNIVRRVAFKIVSGEGTSFHIDENNVKDYTNIIVGAQ